MAGKRHCLGFFHDWSKWTVEESYKQTGYKPYLLRVQARTCAICGLKQFKRNKIDLEQDMETVIYVEYEYPGIMFSETSVTRVSSRSVEAALRDAPEGAYAFSFIERLEGKAEGETVKGKWKNRSGKHFIHGRVMNLKEVKRLSGDHKILISNMEANNIKRVVRCRTGNFQEFTDKDTNHPEENEVSGALQYKGDQFNGRTNALQALGGGSTPSLPTILASEASMKYQRTERNTGLQFRFTENMAGNPTLFITLSGNSITSVHTPTQADRMIEYLKGTIEFIEKHKEKLEK